VPKYRSVARILDKDPDPDIRNHRPTCLIVSGPKYSLAAPETV
jgi:hypothetical protein